MKINEGNFIRELKNKNPRALDYLVDNYSNLIFKVIISVLGRDNREEVMECLNDVLFKVWEKINYHDESKSKFSTWLIAVAKYSAVDYRRKIRKVYKKFDLYELVLEDEITVEEKVLKDESMEELVSIINNLDSPDKEIFIRKYFMEESLKEISKVVKLSVSAVTNRLFRCRKIIKERLDLLNKEVI